MMVETTQDFASRLATFSDMFTSYSQPVSLSQAAKYKCINIGTFNKISVNLFYDFLSMEIQLPVFLRLVRSCGLVFPLHEI